MARQRAVTGGAEWRRMVAGEMYLASDAELVALRANARRILRAYNASVEGPGRVELLTELLGGRAENLWIEPPFYCDYGLNISVGRNVYFNFDCVVLDVAPVTIGDDCMFAPAVQIYTATHPLDPIERKSGYEYAKPIRIGNDVWVGGGAIINPGVTIGDAAVIGSGAVVTKDVPARTFVAGNPARVIRTI